MSSASEPGSRVAGAEHASGAARRRYTRDELLAVKEAPECQKLPAGLEPDDLSDLMESVFFDKSTLFDRSPSGDIYLGPQRGPPPGLRPVGGFAGPRRTGFAAPPGPLHSRLVDDGRSLSPDRDRFARQPSSGLTSAFAVSPGKAPLPGVRPRFDDASKMDRWDSNKGLAGGAEDDWTPRGRAGRVGDWRGGGGGEPGTPGGGPGGLPSRHSLERLGSGWGGREAAPVLNRQASAKDTGGRWAKDDPDDWRARKQAGAPPEPRYDWADRTAAAAGGPAREPPPGFGGPAGLGGRRGVPEWADGAGDAHRGPVTAADIEAERQRMQAQWKAQRAARDGHHEEHEGAPPPERANHHRGEEESNTFLAEVMDDNDFDAWVRDEKAKQAADDAEAEERQRRAAAAPKPGQQIDVKALFGGGGGGGAAAQQTAPSAAPPAADKPAPAAGEAGELGVRSRFANFFKLDEGAPAGAAGQQPPGAAPGAEPAGGPLPGLPPQLPPGIPAGGDGAGNAGSTLLAMLKKQGLGGPPLPGAAPAQQAQQGAGSAMDAELDDVSQVAMSAALQGLDEALGEEEGLAKQAQQPPAQHPQQQQQPGLPAYLQAQQAQHSALLAALGSRPMQPQQQGPPGGLPGILGGGGGGGGGLPGGLPPHQAPGAGYPPGGQPGMQYAPPQYVGMPQAPRPQYPQGAYGMAQPQGPPGQQPGQYGGYPGVAQQPQYRPAMGGMPPQQAALLQQQAQQAQQNALLAQLLAAQQRQQQAAAHAAQVQQAQRMLQQQQAAQAAQQGGQINLAALLAAANSGAGGGGAGMAPQGINPAYLGQPRGVPGMMQPGMGQPQQAAPSAQLHLLQQLQMAAAAGTARGGVPGGGGVPGMAPQPGQGQPPQQPQTGGGMTAAQQQQLLGMLRMGARPQ